MLDADVIRLSLVIYEWLMAAIREKRILENNQDRLQSNKNCKTLFISIGICTWKAELNLEYFIRWSQECVRVSEIFHFLDDELCVSILDQYGEKWNADLFRIFYSFCYAKKYFRKYAKKGSWRITIGDEGLQGLDSVDRRKSAMSLSTMFNERIVSHNASFDGWCQH